MDNGPPPSYQEATGWDPNISANESTRAVTTEETLGRTSTHMLCPSCHAEILTTTITRAGVLTYVASYFICLFSFGLGCCLYPFFIDDCKVVHHYCPNCKESLGQSADLDLD
ncbi:lipopolysaccharide-induced tumor necrosis factor-alpha factor homolog [Drosophila gunungcola]|uniref:LITAF domain-containing protein n=1 Tax=Drosophila gunungcola TaxID=103775 RepID=A0A9P9YKT4_9MUSC|nr:lipopolysaccharide-induced tumor necrosis factor-alpha factor homolog [Drosophila gunungcola]KAI8038823.1 hypothetical protein M5D96_008732 [Drosophila gunungcola]